ncbi:DUF2785 domain-containing protein [Kitasatospora sp. NPDC096147]|uniref:DUF2785 domain-containing protein n=1 Tax=Kitasatospora sp. NPDC096147 TaxID=3364093 RepID=UPI0037F6CFA9
MTDWKLIEAAGFAVPADRTVAGLLPQLSAAPADPDPAVRDGAAYTVLDTWIERGVIPPPLRRSLGDEMAARFAGPRVQARTFAPLVLDMLVTAGDFAPDWVTAFARWYPAEPDLRGHRPEPGWLHAVAHGADLLATFGLHPEVAPERMLTLAAARLAAPTTHVRAQLEGDRPARAIRRVLTRPDLTESQAVSWLVPLGERFRTGPDGPAMPVPAEYGNCLRTLCLLHLLAHRGVRARSEAPQCALRHREAVSTAVADTLDLMVRR